MGSLGLGFRVFGFRRTGGFSSGGYNNSKRAYFRGYFKGFHLFLIFGVVEGLMGGAVEIRRELFVFKRFAGFPYCSALIILRSVLQIWSGN